ncbi:MAG: hypothetical protein ACT4NU_14285 [Chromatiales bacterium]
MATDAIIVLERLRCIRESDVAGGSEPYIWPALLWIDDNTLATPSLVGVTAPALGNARVVIKNDMRAGHIADIPTSVGVLRVRFEDGLSIRRLILAVALWEEDETPEAAMRAGFQAFSSELRAAIADNLFDLNQASEEELDAIIETIKTRVNDRVDSAITNGLTGWQKARVLLGTLNLDDIIGSDFKNFPDLLPTPITLAFPFETGQLLSYGDAGTPGNVSAPVVVGFGGWSDFKFLFAGRNVAGENRIYAVNQDGELLSYGDAGTPGNVSNPVVVGLAGWLDFKFLFAGGNVAGENRIYAVRADSPDEHYEIEGNLQVRPVRVDRCQAEVNAVKAAQSAVDDLDAEIRALQAELQRASPTEKPFIISEIKRLREEELPIVIAALEDARRDLQACRDRIPPIFDPGSVLTQATD